MHLYRLSFIARVKAAAAAIAAAAADGTAAADGNAVDAVVTAAADAVVAQLAVG